MGKKKDVPKEVYAGSLMKSAGIKCRKKDGVIIFVIPSNLEKKLQKELDFSFDMLKIGGDLPLPELARHLDEQAALEGFYGVLVENARYELQVAEDEYEYWWSTRFLKSKEKLKKQHRGKTSNITDKQVESYVKYKYSKGFNRRKKRLSQLEYKYRLLNNAVHASIITRGKMLQSLRNVMQGSNKFGIDVQTDGAKLKL